jgi:hypothetical protein
LFINCESKSSKNIILKDKKNSGQKALNMKMSIKISKILNYKYKYINFFKNTQLEYSVNFKIKLLKYVERKLNKLSPTKTRKYLFLTQKRRILLIFTRKNEQKDIKEQVMDYLSMWNTLLAFRSITIKRLQRA